MIRPLASARRAVQQAGGVAQLLARRARVDVSAMLSASADEACAPLADYEALLSKLRGAGLIERNASPIPPWVLDSFRGKVETEAPAAVEEALARMPYMLRQSLMPFQEEGVRFGLAHGGRCLIGDEMGTCHHTATSVRVVT
jgi:hypothetical protein